MKKPGAVVVLDFLNAAQEGNPHVPRFYLKVAEDLKQKTDVDGIEFESRHVTLPEQFDLAVTKITFNETADESSINLLYQLEEFTAADRDEIIQGLFLEFQGIEYNVPGTSTNYQLPRGQSVRFSYEISGSL